MKYYILILLSFLSAFGLGYTKFFGLTYLSEQVYQQNDKTWIIQIVGAIMTIGPVIAYLFSSPMSASFPKRKLMLYSSFATALFIVIGYLSNWFGTAWLYLFFIGLFMGIFSVAKNALIPIVANHNNTPTKKVNATLSASFILGILSGIYFGTFAFHSNPDVGVAIGIIIFVVCALLPIFCIYNNEEFIPFTAAKSACLENTITILFRYPYHLLSSSLLWGIAGALSLAITAYAEMEKLGSDTDCSLMSLYAAVGTIIGNILSTKIKTKEFAHTLLFVFLFSALIFFTPFFISFNLNYFTHSQVYYLTTFLLVLTGACFGAATNLIDADFLKSVGNEKKEGPGAALQSALISLFSFLIGGGMAFAFLKGWLLADTQFILLSLLGWPPIFCIMFLSFQKKELDYILKPCLAKLTSILLARRYHITVKGLDILKYNNRGALILPNHPAEIDPIILYSILEKHLQPRPVVVENFYHMKGVHLLMKLIKAFPMPDLERGTSPSKKQKVESILQDICESLRKGENVLMYPSGRLMRTGLEHLGAASGVQRILSEVPDVNIIIIRTKGLWGSSFSTALSEGQTPDLASNLKQAFITLLSNGFFFCPKRGVTIEIMKNQNLKRLKDKLTINQNLEDLYNHEGEERLKLIPNRFWSNKVEHIKKHQKTSPENLNHIAGHEKASILNAFSQQFNFPLNTLHESTRLSEDLAMDSLAKAEVMSWLDEVYEVRDIELNELITIADIILIISGQQRTNDKPEDQKENWQERNRPEPRLVEATTLQSSFLKNCDRFSSCYALYDPNTGPLSFKTFKIGVLLMCKEFKSYPDKHIGIMLPSSCAASMAIFAALLAKKIPVMLNWTVGRKNLEHAVESLGLKKVITSSKFLDKIEQTDFGHTKNTFITLESLKTSKFKMGEKIMAWYLSRKSSNYLSKYLSLEKVQENDHAVILFTSGSESSPKAVPLTHKNIISNIQHSLKSLPFKAEDCLYAFLPPFHSFGFTVTSIMPLISGLKVIYHPNPNESRRIVKGIYRYSATHLCGTPTFINGIVRTASKEQLSSLKTLITGAEKLPRTLIESIQNKAPQSQTLEGYGITECSPVLTITKPGRERIGVGQPIVKDSIMIVDPENHKSLGLNERGLILAKGDHIFHGYLGKGQNPFIKINEDTWYQTGDLGYLTECGSLVLSGRMKRFIKIGGEMISLPAMEDTLKRKWPDTENGPSLAIQALEREGKRPSLFLFTDAKITIEEANTQLKTEGFSNLSKLNKSIQLDTLPILGTGKVDYQTLKKIIPCEQ